MQPKTNTVLIRVSGIALAVGVVIWGWWEWQRIDPRQIKEGPPHQAEVGRSFRDGYKAGQALAVYRSEAALRPLSTEEVVAKAMSANAGKFSTAEESDAFDQGFQTGYRAGRKERSAAR